MTSLPTVTKSQTSQSLTDTQRESLIEFLAKHWLDCMDMRDLERFFLDIQTDYLRDYSDEELIGEIEDVTSEEDFALIVNGEYNEA